MKKYLISSALLALGFAVTAFAHAQSVNVQGPIAELGGCDSQESCAAYCDVPENGPACLDYGKKNGLISESEAKALEVLPEQKGPGGCFTDKMCREYCSDIAHSEECFAFAEQHGIGDQQKIKEAKEFLEKTGPGGCKGPEECRTYCEDPAHQEACIEFAEKNGFLSSAEVERAKKLIGKPGPGGCTGPNECRSYCENPENLDACIKFSEENGFMTKEESARIKKAGLIAGPGGCKGTECRTYCEDPAHHDECIKFAEENGLMSKEEASRAKQLIGKPGPGGCVGESCRTYCEDPSHQEECIKFAEENGFLKGEELQRAKKFVQVAREGGPGGCKGPNECRAYCDDESHQEECFEFGKKQGFIRPEDEENFKTGRKLQETIKTAGGPGGCKSENECHSYCSDPSRAEECVAFASAQGGIPPEKAQEMLKQFTEKRFQGRGEFRPPEEFEKFQMEAAQKFEQFRQLEESFRGNPGQFPGFQDGQAPTGDFQRTPSAEGQSRPMVGPGGCASPTECIKYCTEHAQECFNAGPPSGEPGAQNKGGFGPQGQFGQEGPNRGNAQFAPRLRNDLFKEFRPEDGGTSDEFMKKRMENAAEFEKKIFENGGVPNEEFMKKQMENQAEFMKKEFENRREEQKKQLEQFNGQRPGSPEIFSPNSTGQRQPTGTFNQQPFQNTRPPEGFKPPEGTFNQQPFQTARPPEGFKPPEGASGSAPGSFGSFQPPEGFKPPEGTFNPQPSGTFQPPPTNTAPAPVQ